MLLILPLLAVPLVVMLGFWITHRETFPAKEFLLLEGVMVILLVSGFLFARWGAMADIEVWSGRITAKPSGSQHCCHCRQVCDTCTRTVTDSNGRTRTESYSCNCREVCAHFRDYWWALDVSTGDRISVRNCEPNKRRVPAAWSNASVGEPAAVEHTYTNYLLADPESVLRQSAEVDGAAPKYPRVHSYYKINRIINQGTRMPVSAWNEGLMDLNADISKKKQVNVIVVATTKPRSYAQVIERDWLYGKKNDLIFVLGTESDGETVAWADVVTISRVEMLKIKARDTLPGMNLSDPESVLEHIRAFVESDFERTPMAEFEYLSSAAKPSGPATAILYLIAFAGSFIGSLIMIRYDVFSERRRVRIYGRRRW